MRFNARAWTVRALAVLAVAAAAAQGVRLFVLTDRYSVDVPFFDQWDYYNALFQPHSPWELFAWQHGPHRQGVGFLLTAAVNDATDWNQRALCFMGSAVMVLAAGAALWLKGRLFGRLAWHDVALPLIILSPQQWEVFVNTPNLSHGVMPLFLVMLVCLSWTIESRPARYALVLALTFLTTFTGFGMFMGFVTPMIIGLDLWPALRSKRLGDARLAGGALFLSLAVLGLFFIGYKFSPAIPNFQFPDPAWKSYPRFIALEFAALFGKTEPTTAATAWGGAAALVVMVSAAVVGWRSRRDKAWSKKERVVLTLLLFSLVFSTATAVGRISMGLHQAMVSRYLPLMMPAAIGLYLAAAGLGSRRRRGLALAAALAATILAAVPQRETEEMRVFRDRKAAWAESFRREGSIPEADYAAGFPVHPRAEATGLERKLEILKQNKWSLFRDGWKAP